MEKRDFLFIAVFLVAMVFVGGCKTTQVEITSPPSKNVPGPISVAITSAPKTASVGEKISISWAVEGMQKTIPHTAIHYDYNPHPDRLFRNVDLTEGENEYPAFTQDFYDGQFEIPKTFTASITPEKEGIIYYRAHATVDGKNYWTDEKIITVSSKS